MDYIADDLEGEAPCEFCGQLYPLVLLIEHQSIHLIGEDDYSYLEDFVNQEEVAQNIIAEDLGLVTKPQVNVELIQQSAVKNEPQVIVEQIQQSAVKNEASASKGSANTMQNLNSPKAKTSDENTKTELKRSSPESNDQITYSELSKRRRNLSRSSSSRENDVDFRVDEPNEKELDDADISVVFETKTQAEKATTEQKQSLLFSKTLKELKKFPEQKRKEFITETGEKLLVYGDEIDPDKDLENEKPAYKMPNNPLLNSVSKNEDVEDINNLSDDDCNESLEEFWKRARDFLKRNRVRNEC